jgi:hypothetical protein
MHPAPGGFLVLVLVLVSMVYGPWFYFLPPGAGPPDFSCRFPVLLRGLHPFRFCTLHGHMPRYCVLPSFAIRQLPSAVYRSEIPHAILCPTGMAARCEEITVVISSQTLVVCMRGGPDTAFAKHLY